MQLPAAMQPGRYLLMMHLTQQPPPRPREAQNQTALGEQQAIE